jgi:hypothetical protein
VSEHVPEPVPYADPKLPVGPTGFEVRSYPSDGAGYVGGRVRDDGVNLSLEPTGTLNARWIPIGLIWLAWSASMILYSETHRRPATTTPVWFSRAAGILFVTGTGLLFWYLLKPESNSRVPWITVDRMAKRILLPRGEHSFPFHDVVRLQVVSFGHVGASADTLTYRGKPDTGELQIVFRKSGQEHTWAVVSSPYGPAVKQFSVAFRGITGIPVSRAYRNLIGEWQVEPFDGEWDVAAPDA